ncbi:thermonuclease family protein [Candidatus Uhrbacteria bacterium]|nr:thermonuclease family protein [Candidatus Uhrbacteria bacterium]
MRRNVVVMGAVLFLCGASFALATHGRAQQDDPVFPLEIATVLRVVDGDTVVVSVQIDDEGTLETRRIRLIGIDAPEKRSADPYWRKATERLETLMLGKTVTLERQTRDWNRYFHYGRRYLRDFFVFDAGSGQTLFVNAVMVQDGFARASPLVPNTDHEDELQACEDDARAHHRGLWKGSSKDE